MRIHHNIRKIQVLTFLLAGWALDVGAQGQQMAERQLFFKRISSEQGLPQPTVNSIIRDSRGFVWIATEDGLCRFDGTEFKTFRHDPDDSASLSHNVVHFIQEETETGNLWVGSISGLSYFDRSLERFKVYNADATPGIIYANAALDKKRGRLWLACSVGGLRYVDLARQQIVTVRQHGLDRDAVWSVKLRGDSLLIGTLQGLKILNLQTQEISILNHQPIRALLAEASGLWFGTEGFGLGHVDRATGQTTYYTRQNHGINNDNVWSLARDKDGNLWVGTDGGGLNILAPGRQTAVYLNSELDERSLSSNTIRAIFIEPSGNAWLGTYNGGLNYREVAPVQFVLYRHELFNEQSLRHNAVSSFQEAGDGTIWVGTDGGGLHYLKDGILHRYALPPGLSHINVITSLLADGSGLWIGTYQHGLVYLDGRGGWKQYIHKRDNNTSIANNNVWAIQKDSTGCLWVGTDRGVNRFTPGTGVFHHLDHPIGGNIDRLFVNMQAQTLLISSAQTLWVGSYGVLAAYVPAADSIIRINGVDRRGRFLPDLRVKTLLEDAGKIWIGTYGNGLCRYDTHTGVFQILDERDGLPDNTVLGIARADARSLWLSTNQGLTCFNEADTTFTVFDTGHGVQGTIFNRNAVLQTRDGRLLFGGTSGFNIFRPRQLTIDTSSLAIVFTGFHIFNTQIKPGSGSLKQSIAETHKIDLSHADSRLITLQFSAFDFLSPEKVIYQYRLEGFNNTWQTAGKDHSVTFTNLDPGQYRLVVRASRNRRTWGPQKSLTVVIQTVWWKTNAFRISAFLLFCLTGLTIYRYRVYTLKERKKELELLVNQQSLEIKKRSDDLATQNEELKSQNEEMVAQQDTITAQNLMLAEAQKSLRAINESLELTVQQRTEKLNETIVQLNKTIKELDAFVYSASHDLIAPLKSVMGLIYLMRKENRQNELSSYIDLTEGSIKKLEGVIKNMIQYSQNSSLDIDYSDVNLYDLVQECLSDLQFIPGMEVMHFEIGLDKAFTVVTDRKRLRIILSNLINNAVKYHDANKTPCFVRIDVEPGKTVWKLSIEDNGIGIAKSYLSRIFEMFYRATDRSQGSGLGLYIVKETVERLYGEIYVDSENGLWTKFTMAFPYERMYVRKK